MLLAWTSAAARHDLRGKRMDSAEITAMPFDLRNATFMLGRDRREPGHVERPGGDDRALRWLERTTCYLTRLMMLNIGR